MAEISVVFTDHEGRFVSMEVKGGDFGENPTNAEKLALICVAVVSEMMKEHELGVFPANTPTKDIIRDHFGGNLGNDDEQQYLKFDEDDD